MQIEKERHFWDRFSGKYDLFIQKTVGAAYQKMYAELCKDISSNDEILEIATGTGLIAFEIEPFAKQITAIDISPAMIDIAKKKQQEKNTTKLLFEVGDSDNLPYESKTFDVVIASNVLHLLHEPEKTLAEIRRVLKPSGKAILPTFCHAENSSSQLISTFMHFFGFSARNKWTIKNYILFVEKAGFSVVKSKIIKARIPLVYLVTN